MDELTDSGVTMEALIDVVDGLPTFPRDGGVTWVNGLACDSRKVKEGDVFFALSGSEVDGNAFVEAAIKKGAAAIVSEQPSSVEMENAPLWIQVRKARQALGRAADLFYGHPSANMPVVGITGTNGKTTTAFLVHHLLKSAWHRCGLIGTVHYDLAGRLEPAPNTTPESIEIHRLLAEMEDEGCRAAVMEVSSHGLEQDRVGAVSFAAGVFTNLTQDHLDYHGTMERYFESKRMLFRQIDALAAKSGSGKRCRPTVILNLDDKYGAMMADDGFDNARVITFGQGAHCEFKVSQLKSNLNGTTFQLEREGRSFLVRMPLIGRFNVYNAVAALAVAHALDLNLREAVKHLAEAPQVPGRLESVVDQHLSFRVYVDYAHTPDALENVLATLRDLQPRRIITVFGCGGDRDRLKRPLMGRAVENGSDLVIVTSDNPRNEDPEAIIRDVCSGMTENRHAVVVDRRAAIEEAINRARPRDIILIAGKGHEDYQEIGGKRHHFSDRKVARGLIAARIEADAERRKEKEDGW